MRERALYLLKTYLLTVVIFIIAKPVFMIYNSASHPFTFTDVIDVIYHGLSLDLSTALYFLILPFLLMVVSLFWKKLNIIATILKVYWAEKAEHHRHHSESLLGHRCLCFCFGLCGRHLPLRILAVQTR